MKSPVHSWMVFLCDPSKIRLLIHFFSFISCWEKYIYTSSYICDGKSFISRCYFFDKFHFLHIKYWLRAVMPQWNANWLSNIVFLWVQNLRVRWKQSLYVLWTIQCIMYDHNSLMYERKFIYQSNVKDNNILWLISLSKSTKIKKIQYFSVRFFYLLVYFFCRLFCIYKMLKHRYI